MKHLVFVLSVLCALISQGHSQTASAPAPTAIPTYAVQTAAGATSAQSGYNTVIARNGRDVQLSVVANGTNLLFWGLIPPAAVTMLCTLKPQQTETIMFTGDKWTSLSSYTLNVTLLAQQGCNSSPDQAGTQALIQDPTGRQDAVQCAKVNGTTNCLVWWTGSDVDTEVQQAMSQLAPAAGPAAKSPPAGRHLLSAEDEQDLKDLDLSGNGRKLHQSQKVCNTVASGLAYGGLAAGGAVGAGSAFVAASTTAVIPVVGPLIAGGLIIGGIVAANKVDSTCGSGNGGKGCFPGDALVTTWQKGEQSISSLQINDLVAYGGQGDAKLYSPVYAFGHKDHYIMSWFLDISFVDAESTEGRLRMTEDHFLYTFAGKPIRAKDVRAGIQIQIADPKGGLKSATVTGVHHTLAKGLFNPFTVKGRMLVNGVVVSVHSEWFLDSLFDKIGIYTWLPTAYQIVLKPWVLLRTIIGQEHYHALYNFVDKHIDIASSGTDYAWHSFIAAAAIPAGIGGVLALRSKAI